MKLVWKLLRQNISIAQLSGFFVSNLIGLSIVLVALQFYLDTKSLFTTNDSLFRDDFITITKNIGLLNSFSEKYTHFTSSEIESLKEQRFVKDVGEFTSSDFAVLAGINNSNFGMEFKTEMFFESVPDKFIDVHANNWNYDPSNEYVPIILPKNYLDLYNFGFAQANGMPKLSEGLISMLNMDLVIYGRNQQRRVLKGNIVGFSNRINTILVPESFMQWANTNFGSKENSDPSRLIVQINNISDPDLVTYFKEKNYVVSGENTSASKMSYFLKILLGIVLTIGVFICLLSLFILTLSIYLLLEKNMVKLRILRLIGYDKQTVVRPYLLLLMGLNFMNLLIALLVVFLIRDIYTEALGKLFVLTSDNTFVITIGVGASILVLLTAFNYAVIRHKIK